MRHNLHGELEGLARSGNWAAVILRADEVLRSDDICCHYILGCALKARGENAEELRLALKLFRGVCNRAGARTALRAKALANTVTPHLWLGSIGPARRAVSEYLDHLPEWEPEARLLAPHYLFKRGQIHAAERQYDEAVRSFRRVLTAADPRYDQLRQYAQLWAAECETAAGRLDSALRYLDLRNWPVRHGIHLEPRTMAFYSAQVARWLYARGDLPKAAWWARQAIHGITPDQFNSDLREIGDMLQLLLQIAATGYGAEHAEAYALALYQITLAVQRPDWIDLVGRVLTKDSGSGVDDPGTHCRCAGD